MSGTYTAAVEDKKATWTFTSCGPGCAHVASDSNWTADAKLANGQWTMSRVADEGVTCDDGTSSPGTVTYSWDAVTLQGNIIAKSQPGACGNAESTESPSHTLTLTKTG